MSQASTSSTVTMPKAPMFFDEFFERGLQETESPFLTPAGRAWGANITLKASVLAACLLVVSFGLRFIPVALPLSHLLLFFVYFLVGIPSLIESLEDLGNLEINIDMLMTLAAFSSVFIGSGLEGALLLVLFALSGAMEDAVTSKAKSAISSLHKLSPTKACVIDSDGVILEKAVQDIPVGSSILIKAGEVVPLDGKVTAGASALNLVHLTGESMPITVKVGDEVPSGGYNLDGVLTVSVIRTSNDSTLARIIELVTQAQEARPALQRWFDRLSQNYATAIIILALSFALLLPWILQIPYFGIAGSLYRALAFLIAASPCALIIAIPIAYLSAVGACARKGILLKGGITLDALASCTAIAFDKTGTLTLGDLVCDNVEQVPLSKPLNGDSQIESATAVAYALERNAVHPIAKAIEAYYGQQKNLPLIPLEGFKSVPGYGLEAEAQLPQGPCAVAIGSVDYIASKLSEQDAQIVSRKVAELHLEGRPLALLLIKDEVFLFHFRDVLRPKIGETVKALLKKGLRVVMLTGDHVYSARSVAEEVGITDFYADLKPEDKLHYISKLSQTEKLAMIGDGVNDAPALARATVGICMGKVGSASAIEAADVVLLNDNIEMLGWLFAKAYQTQVIVKQNLVLAAGVIALATLPALMGEIPLWLAVIMHEGGTVLVGLNALRLLRK